MFEIELELWAAATTIDKDKQGITIALSLPDDDKLHLRSTVLDKIDKKKLKSADGLETLTAVLKELLGEDQIEDGWNKYDEFENYKRKSGESMAEFISNFESKYEKVKKNGTEIPSEEKGRNVSIQCVCTLSAYALYKRWCLDTCLTQICHTSAREWTRDQRTLPRIGKYPGLEDTGNAASVCGWILKCSPRVVRH